MSRLSRKILQDIEKRGLTPRPALYFLAKRSVFWLLTLLAVALAGLSVALGIFGVRDYLDTGGRRLDEMPLDDLAAGIPVLSVATFLLFVFSTYLAYARTPRGYRMQPLTTVGLAAAAGILLGIGLYAVKVGPAVHEFLSGHIPGYRAYTTIPYDEWRKPREGRLGGEALAVKGHILHLRDFDGQEWTVDMSQAAIQFSGSPVEEGDVAIRGVMTGPFTFKAKSIEPFD